MATALIESNGNQQLQNDASAEQTRSKQLFLPRTDIYESADQLVLVADMPGVKQDGIDITLEQNILTIYGRAEEPELPGYRLAYAEYVSGDFRRVFALSNEIDRDGIKATMKNGVLRLVLPKSSKAMPRKIAVNPE
jgi:HSP20 family molecular chaperone IbpA